MNGVIYDFSSFDFHIRGETGNPRDVILSDEEATNTLHLKVNTMSLYQILHSPTAHRVMINSLEGGMVPFI